MEERAAEAVDDYLPGGSRRALEERLWRPTATGAGLEALLDDPLFLDEPGPHPAPVVRRGGGYPPERTADVVAERAVDVLVVPGEQYPESWWNPLTPRGLRDRFTPREVC